MNRICFIALMILAAAAQYCRDSTDEAIREGAFEIAYHYYSGDMPADRHINITIVINKNGCAVQREQRSINNTSKNINKIVQLQVTEQELWQLYGMLASNDFFRIKTKKVVNSDARTIYLKIKKGDTVYICEEGPVASITTNESRQNFFNIIKELNSFVKNKLLPNQKYLVQY
jgi:hypothetical protein